jgi:histidinol-phosphate aminotransferase
MEPYDPGPHPTSSDKYLCLHRNENLFVTTRWTVDAVREAIGTLDIRAYPDAMCLAVRRALAELYGVEPEEVYVSNGADGVLADLLGLMRERFDVLGTLDVSFRFYRDLARRHRYRLEILPGDTFRTGRVVADHWQGLAVVDSPNAITGATIEPETMAGLADSAESFLIWDNVYGELAGDDVSQIDRENLAVVRSFSKFYALAGLRIGYCLASKSVVADLLARKDPFAVNAVAQKMALVALERQEQFLAIAEEMKKCKVKMVAALGSLGFVLEQNSAAHFVLVRHQELEARTLEQGLRELGVLVRHFPGEVTGRYLRITVPPMADIERLYDCLESVCAVEPRSRGGEPDVQ